MNLLEPEAPIVDPRRQRVLEGALRSFLAYGFSRTTMDDIARAADMSRPGLYLLFRNKSEIYRALAAGMLDASMSKAERALSSPAGFGDRLTALFEDCIVDLLEKIAASPHGGEILDMKGSLAGDLVAGFRSRLSARLEAAIAEEAAQRGVPLDKVGPTARDLADMLLDAMHGATLRQSSADEQRRSAWTLVRTLEMVLAGNRPAGSPQVPRPAQHSSGPDGAR